MRALSKRLETMKITDFDRENVMTCSSLIKSALHTLGKANAPIDILHLMKRTFEVSGMKEFNAFVQKLYFNHDQDVKKLITDGHLLKAESKYTELKTDGCWLAINIDPNESVFVCFNCGDANCTANTCPKPKNDCLIAKRKARFQAQTGGRGRGRNRSNGGRGGGGRSNSRNRGNGSGNGGGNGGNNGGNNNGKTVDRTPPANGEPHEANS